MSDNALLVPDNICDGGTAYTGQAGAEVAGGSHNDQEPSRVTSLSGMLPSVSQFRVEASEAGLVDFVEIVNHNLDRRRDSYWRAWVADRDAQPFSIFTGIQELYPTSLDASSNLTGTYTDVDDNPWASASSSDYLQPTGVGAWSARFGFATPSSALSSVGNDHLFVLRVFPSLSINSGTLTVTLYEAGSPVATLLNAVDVGATDRLDRVIYIAKFSTSQLGTASGADVQIQIDASQEVRVASVLWCAGLDVTGGNDSGWIQIDQPPSSASFGSLSAGISEEPMPAEFYRFASSTDLSAAGVPMVAAAFVNATNDASPTNKLGVLVAGKAWELPYNPESVSLTFEDRSARIEALGGQDTGSNLRRRRVFRLPLQLLTRAQQIEVSERIDWRKGQVGAFYVNIFPNDTTLRRMWGAWVRVAEPGEWVPINVMDSDDTESVLRFSRTYLLREKL